MAISVEQYDKLTKHLLETLSKKEIDDIIAGDLSPLRDLIVDELLLNDYCGTVIDIIFEDLFTQHKRPILKKQFGKLADFLISDLSIYMLRHNLSLMVKK